EANRDSGELLPAKGPVTGAFVSSGARYGPISDLRIPLESWVEWPTSTAEWSLSEVRTRVLARRTHPILTDRGRALGAAADDCASSIAVARMGPSALSLLPEATASPARRSIASVPRSRRLELAELHLQRGEPLRRNVACGVVGHWLSGCG